MSLMVITVNGTENTQVRKNTDIKNISNESKKIKIIIKVTLPHISWTIILDHFYGMSLCRTRYNKYQGPSHSSSLNWNLVFKYCSKHMNCTLGQELLGWLFLCRDETHSELHGHKVQCLLRAGTPGPGWLGSKTSSSTYNLCI